MSSVRLDASRVLAECDRWLKSRSKVIEEKREEMIWREMSRTPGFLGRIFGARQPTREEAIAKLKCSKAGFGFVSEWNLPAFKQSSLARLVSDLECAAYAAVVAGDHLVTVDARLVSILFPRKGNK